MVIYTKLKIYFMNTSSAKRGLKIIGITLLIYTVLVASHEGEFWPFSIYPMFSQAGNPWTRAMVIDVTDRDANEMWEVHALDDRTADVVSVGYYNVDQIDFSNFVSKTENWTGSRRNALIGMFGSNVIGDRQWMVSKVKGELIGADSIAIRIIPFIKISSGATELNPNLPESDYFRGNNELDR